MQADELFFSYDSFRDEKGVGSIRLDPAPGTKKLPRLSMAYAIRSFKRFRVLVS